VQQHQVQVVGVQVVQSAVEGRQGLVGPQVSWVDLAGEEELVARDLGGSEADANR